MKQLARLSHVNGGTLSRILNGSNAIAVSQLDLLTQAMDYPEGYFYEAYIDELSKFPTTFRRIKPFLMRCAELNHLDTLKTMISRLLDNLSHSASLFEVAEDLYTLNHLPAAAIIYEHVSEAERFQHSERLALCRYRLFTIALSEKNVEENVKAALIFEGFVDRLDEADQLEAIRQLINVWMAKHKWEKVDILAKKMLKLAKVEYTQKLIGKKTKHPIYFYILYSWLVQGTVSAELKDYENALEFVVHYANGEDWIHEQDETAKWYISQFSEWATANTYLYLLLSGHMEALEKYAEYIESKPDEIFIALAHIVEAANQYNFNINHILDKFEEYIPSISNLDITYSEYNPAIMTEKVAQFFCDLAVYKANQNPQEAIQFILDGLQISVTIHSVRNIINGMTLFEKYAYHATKEDMDRYNKLSHKVKWLA